MAKIDFRKFDRAQDWLERMRDPELCIDFGFIAKKDRESLVEFLADNGFIVPDPDHEIYWWDGQQERSRYKIDIYLPVYKVARAFRLLDEEFDKTKTCSWKKDEYVLLDYDLKMWWSEKDASI